MGRRQVLRDSRVFRQGPIERSLSIRSLTQSANAKPLQRSSDGYRGDQENRQGGTTKGKENYHLERVRISKNPTPMRQSLYKVVNDTEIVKYALTRNAIIQAIIGRKKVVILGIRPPTYIPQEHTGGQAQNSTCRSRPS